MKKDNYDSVLVGDWWFLNHDVFKIGKDIEDHNILYEETKQLVKYALDASPPNDDVLASRRD